MAAPIWSKTAFCFSKEVLLLLLLLSFDEVALSLPNHGCDAELTDMAVDDDDDEEHAGSLMGRVHEGSRTENAPVDSITASPRTAKRKRKHMNGSITRDCVDVNTP